MKHITLDDGRPALVPETDTERAAIQHVKTHVPIFAGAEGYGLDAFVAGAQWAREQLSALADGWEVQARSMSDAAGGTLAVSARELRDAIGGNDGH